MQVGKVEINFRPHHGNISTYEEARAQNLAQIIQSTLRSRFQKGIKIKVIGQRTSNVLENLTNDLLKQNLTIQRIKMFNLDENIVRMDLQIYGGNNKIPLMSQFQNFRQGCKVSLRDFKNLNESSVPENGPRYFFYVCSKGKLRRSSSFRSQSSRSHSLSTYSNPNTNYITNINSTGVSPTSGHEIDPCPLSQSTRQNLADSNKALSVSKLQSQILQDQMLGSDIMGVDLSDQCTQKQAQKDLKHGLLFSNNQGGNFKQATQDVVTSKHNINIAKQVIEQVVQDINEGKLTDPLINFQQDIKCPDNDGQSQESYTNSEQSNILDESYYVSKVVKPQQLSHQHSQNFQGKYLQQTPKSELCVKKEYSTQENDLQVGTKSYEKQAKFVVQKMVEQLLEEKLSKSLESKQEDLEGNLAQKNIQDKKLQITYVAGDIVDRMIQDIQSSQLQHKVQNQDIVNSQDFIKLQNHINLVKAQEQCSTQNNLIQGSEYMDNSSLRHSNTNISIKCTQVSSGVILSSGEASSIELVKSKDLQKCNGITDGYKATFVKNRNCQENIQDSCCDFEKTLEQKKSTFGDQSKDDQHQKSQYTDSSNRLDLKSMACSLEKQQDQQYKQASDNKNLIDQHTKAQNIIVVKDNNVTAKSYPYTTQLSQTNNHFVPSGQQSKCCVFRRLRNLQFSPIHVFQSDPVHYHWYKTLMGNNYSINLSFSNDQQIWSLQPFCDKRKFDRQALTSNSDQLTTLPENPVKLNESLQNQRGTAQCFTKVQQSQPQNSALVQNIQLQMLQQYYSNFYLKSGQYAQKSEQSSQNQDQKIVEQNPQLLIMEEINPQNFQIKIQ